MFLATANVFRVWANTYVLSLFLWIERKAPCHPAGYFQFMWLV